MNDTDRPVKNKEDRLRWPIPPKSRPENGKTTPNTSASRKHPMPPNSPLPTTSYSPEYESSVTEEEPLTKNAPFTEEDIEILEEEYPDIIDIPPEGSVYAWIAFARKVRCSVCCIPASLCRKGPVRLIMVQNRKHSAGDWNNIYHTIFLKRKFREREDKDDSEDQSQIGPSTDKAKFLENLKEVSNSIKYGIEPSFSLYGCKLELYDLWSVVNKPEFGGFKKVEEANRWLQVAVKLGINTYKNDMAHAALKQVYCDSLVDLDTYISTRKNCETKGSTILTSTAPVTPVTDLPLQASERTRPCGSSKKDGGTRGRVAPTKYTEPVTPVKAIPKQTPEQARILSSGVGVSSPKTLWPTTILPQESANTDIAAQRIRQSLGHGELPFLQSLNEFAREFLDSPVTFQPIVSGRKISLFNVWAASLPLLGHFDEIVDDIESREVWDDLAIKLGFEISAHPSASDELREICDDFLVDFYDFFIMREQRKVKEGALGHQSEVQGQSDEESVVRSDDTIEAPSLSFRSAPPERQKRPHDWDDISPIVESRPTSSHSHNKRPRISKGKGRADEIPSTPEHIYNSHLSSDGKFSESLNSDKKKLIEANIEYFPPRSPSNELDSSPSRQLQSEIVHYTPPSQNNIDEEATQSQTDSQYNGEIDEFFVRFKAKGFDRDLIWEMLNYTTMDAELAEKLLLDHANGLKVPKNLHGVWTEEDDNEVMSHVQSGDYKRALRKHGADKCLMRIRYLEDVAMAQRDNA